MKIIDAFSFFNELELLELRLETLNEVVDHFILCESTKTHSGLDKPLYFNENKDRFKKFQDKIIHLIFEPKEINNSWKIEYDQRNYLEEGIIKIVNDLDDIIILSDIDEIPNPNNFRFNDVKDGCAYYLSQTVYYYYLNYKCTNISWGGSQVFNYRSFRNSKNLLSEIRRDNNIGFYSEPCHLKRISIENNGWHFSYLGGTEKVIQKMNSFMHQELKQNTNLNKDIIEQKINSGNWIWNDGQQVNLKKVEIDNSYPKYLLNNINKFKHLIKE